MWFRRTYEDILRRPTEALRLFPVWLFLGPRQVGKSSLLRRCAGPDRQIVNLDDLATRGRAHRDPALFAADLRLPLLIDEIQYAPALLSAIKQLADRPTTPPGAIWLTGSQSFEVMHGVQESLAGRVAVLNLFGLSDEEKGSPPTTPKEAFERIWSTSFPKLQGVCGTDAVDLYLSSYLQTYIERDVRELLGIQKRREFEIFVRMCALRTGQVLNTVEIARDAGISPNTAKDWISLLEDSFLIRLVHPHHSNRTLRMIKSPKLYFLDAGLAAWLAGWRDPETLRLSPMACAIYETQVFGELLRHYRHRAREVDITYWRTRDGEEIDFLVEAAGRICPIEVKMGTPDGRALPRLERMADSRWDAGRVVSLLHLGPDTLPATIAEGWQGASTSNLSFLP
ncbi:MAG: ATP-binding protein [Verrucomicrobia bacterium]|nr:ATP-binding protein [Verrucomicrobiota bacterium]